MVSCGRIAFESRDDAGESGDSGDIGADASSPFTSLEVTDGVQRGLGGTESIATGQPGPWQSLYMFDGGAGPMTISFQVRDGLAQTTTLDHLSAVVVPLAPEADPLYHSVDNITSVTTAGYSDVAPVLETAHVWKPPAEIAATFARWRHRAIEGTSAPLT